MDLKESLTALDAILRFGQKAMRKGPYVEDPKNEFEHWGENVAPEDLRPPQKNEDYPNQVKNREWTQKWMEANPRRENKLPEKPKTY